MNDMTLYVPYLNDGWNYPAVQDKANIIWVCILKYAWISWQGMCEVHFLYILWWIKLHTDHLILIIYISKSIIYIYIYIGGGN
jgi:hypothetical protein